MKNILIILAVLMAICFAMAFKSEQVGNAVVEKRSGLDVYVYSTPTKPYDLVSSEKFVVAMNCNEIFIKPLKKALGKGDGVIIYPELSKFDIIKYK